MASADVSLRDMIIDSYSFGHIRIDGVAYLKDVIIVRDRVHSPWWRQAGGHIFAPEDLEIVFSAAPKIVCLGTGFYGQVRIGESARLRFSALGIRIVVDRTAEVVDRFNSFVRAGEDVAAALHLTC